MVLKLEEEFTAFKIRISDFFFSDQNAGENEDFFGLLPMTNHLNPLSRRCPRLGGPVGFKYCMSSEGEQPCAKVVDCWWETFDILHYLRDNLSEAQFDRLLNARPRPKVASLVELIAQAKKRQDV
jgi:hypothetical protein